MGQPKLAREIAGTRRGRYNEREEGWLLMFSFETELVSLSAEQRNTAPVGHFPSENPSLFLVDQEGVFPLACCAVLTSPV